MKMTATKMNSNQVKSLESLNQQIIDNQIPNVQPYPISEAMSACNDAGNSNAPTDLKQSHKSAEIWVSDLDELHRIIVSNAERINFEAYIDKLGGNHKKYIKDNQFKPNSAIIAVVVANYALELINRLGYSIAQLFSNDAETKAGYVFNGKYWQSITEGAIRNLLRALLVRMGYDPVESQTPYLGNLLAQTFWTITLKIPNKDNSRILINLNSKTLEVLPDGAIRLLPFSKDDFLLYCLPYEYKADAKRPIFTKYIDRVLPDKESQAVLQELLGSIFVRSLNLEKIGILLGNGANGKSVLLKIITALLGNDNVSQMDLKSLTTDRNADNNRAHLMGKLLNFAPEINAKGEQAHDLIKRMASREAIQVKMLYKDTITITDYANLIFNANSLPSDVEHTHGFFRRFLIIDFDQTITNEEKDPNLASKIIAHELPAVLNWIIEGAQRLQKNQAFSDCKKSADILEEYKLESDAVAMWLEERGYTPHDNLTKLLKDLIPDLRNYVIDGGYKMPSSKTIAKRLRDLGYKTTKPKGYPTNVYITINTNN